MTELPAHVQNALATFIQYIKDRKSVDLEDLAVEFGLKVKVSSELRSRILVKILETSRLIDITCHIYGLRG